MKPLIVKGLILGWATVASCNQLNRTHPDNIAMEPVAETVESKSVSDQAGTTDAPRFEALKVIKNAQTRFKVKNVDEALKEAEVIVSKYKGYISDMRFQNNSHQLENRFTIRTPHEHFDPLLKELQGLAVFVDYTDITTLDVTEEYMDLQTRLETKLEVKKRYEQILRSRAKTVEDLLLTEQKLGELQEEIEAAQGRLNFLNNKVALSTIQVDVYETVQHQDRPAEYIQSFGSKVKDSLSSGWHLLQLLLLGILYIWPLVLMGCGLFLYLRFRRQKSANR